MRCCSRRAMRRLSLSMRRSMSLSEATSTRFGLRRRPRGRRGQLHLQAQHLQELEAARPRPRSPAAGTPMRPADGREALARVGGSHAMGQRVQPRRIDEDRRALQLQVDHLAAVDALRSRPPQPVQRRSVAQRVERHLLHEARQSTRPAPTSSAAAGPASASPASRAQVEVDAGIEQVLRARRARSSGRSARATRPASGSSPGCEAMTLPLHSG